MMGASRAGDFVFAQPRLQARHAALLGAGMWAELEQIADFGQFLQSVRATALAPAIEAFGALSPVDDMEIALRRGFAARVEEMAYWFPESWQPAILWVRTLPWLPFRGRPRDEAWPGWMAADLAVAGDDQTAEESEENGDFPWGTEDWLAHWRTLWPYEVAGLAEIGRALAAAAAPDLGGDAPWPERRERFTDSLTRAFRRHSFGPGAAFAHLGLLCLEFGRLRGNLSARRTHLIV